MMAGAGVVLVLVKGLGLGGAERLITEAAGLWDRRRFQYHVAYVLPWKDHLVPALTGLGIPVHLLGGGTDPDLGAGRRLRRLIKEIGAGLVHAHLPTAGIMARLVSPVPVVYTEHNLAHSYRWPTRFVNRLTYGRNRAVLAVSEAVAASLRGYPGPPPMIIPNGVSVSDTPFDTERARAELGIEVGTPLVVHVGNIRPHKGHATLLAVAEHLQRIRGDVVVISIGGEKTTGDLARLQEQTRTRGLTNLRFLGRRDDALAFMAAADVFVNPADVEGLPVAVLEAMAVGTPVVATAVGGVPSVVRHEETGLLCPPGEARGLAEAIDSLLSDRLGADLMADAAQALVRREYGLEPMVRRVEEVYGGVLDG